MKTALELPDDCKIVVILTMQEASAIGRLLRSSIKLCQASEQTANMQPPLAHLRSAQEALENSYALADCCPWLADAEVSLARGNADLETELKDA